MKLTSSRLNQQHGNLDRIINEVKTEVITSLTSSDNINSEKDENGNNINKDLDILDNIKIVLEDYSNTINNYFNSILETNIDSNKTLWYQKTRNQDKIVVPNLNPFAAIGMMCQRSLPDRA